MARIKHPNPPHEGTFTDRLGRDLGGIIFRDGYADVDLADKPNLHAAYIQHGYGIDYDVDDLFPDQTSEVLLSDMTIAALRELAAAELIDLPKKLRKHAEIVEYIEHVQALNILTENDDAKPTEAIGTVDPYFDQFNLAATEPAGPEE
ncbi:hypothetical protein BH09ACT9_BH09ACT9_00670 [soil metagenome]